MNAYVFSGTLNLGRETPEFEREVEAESEEHAREKLYSELGSEHSLNRGKIKLDQVEEK